MRIDLFTGGNRPFPIRVALALARRYVGVDLGPPTAATYRNDLFPKVFHAYMMRGLHGARSWDRGHVEMFSAFVSRQNSCSF